MRQLVDEVLALRHHLGHVHARGHRTLMITGSVPVEADYGGAKTDAPAQGSHKRRRTSQAGKKTHTKDFFRRVEMLFKRRELSRSVNADKTAARPVQDVYAETTKELERVSWLARRHVRAAGSLSSTFDLCSCQRLVASNWLPAIGLLCRR